MASMQSLRSSQQLLGPVLRPNVPSLTLLRSLRQSLYAVSPRQVTPHRHASSTAPPSKPTVLEQPGKFRPPSHPQRIVPRRPGQGGGAYNQASTPRERENQKTRKYPHTFPNEGTLMHWFLLNKAIHLWITLGILFSLAILSLSQTFLHTSPYAHLVPPLSSIILHPINFTRESWAVFRLHLDYTTRQSAESRAQNILDAQKRRIFRRANGIENLDEEDDQGVDVRGIVPWDDGLTNPERERGGRRIIVTSRADLEAEGRPGETIDDLGKRRVEEREARRRQRQAEKTEEAARQQQQQQDQQAVVEQEQPKRKRKLWLGIW